MEWHIERIIECAKRAIAQQESAGAAGVLDVARAPLAGVLASAGLASMAYQPGDKLLTHIGAGGAACDTPLPAVLCACGRYLLVGGVPPR